MNQPWSLIITTVGAVLTTLLGVLVGGAITSRSQQRHWSRDRQTEACAQVLRESSNVLIQLAAANGRLVNPTTEQLERPVPGLPTLLDWRPWNEALAMASLLADHQLVEAALTIDAEIWPIHLKIKARAVAEGDWFALRDKIEDRRRDFVNVARNHLASAGPKLTRLTGRPNPEDPIWQLHRLSAPPHGDQEQAAES
jgi:hypothetical protein